MTVRYKRLKSGWPLMTLNDEIDNNPSIACTPRPWVSCLRNGSRAFKRGAVRRILNTFGD